MINGLFASNSITLNKKADIFAASGIAIKDGNSNSNFSVTINNRAKVTGNINLVNSIVGDRLIIQGDYHGDKDSKLLPEVTPEQNYADKLHIGRNASDTTVIDLTEVSGLVQVLLAQVVLKLSLLMVLLMVMLSYYCAIMLTAVRMSTGCKKLKITNEIFTLEKYNKPV